VLDCTSLAVFKGYGNRTKDWADLEVMAQAGQLDVDAEGLLGKDEPQLERPRQLG
jgi:hypothetical protein